MNENTTLKEAERELKNCYQYLSRLCSAGLGISLEELIRGQKGTDYEQHSDTDPRKKTDSAQ